MSEQQFNQGARRLWNYAIMSKQAGLTIIPVGDNKLVETSMRDASTQWRKAIG